MNQQYPVPCLWEVVNSCASCGQRLNTDRVYLCCPRCGKLNPVIVVSSVRWVVVSEAWSTSNVVESMGWYELGETSATAGQCTFKGAYTVQPDELTVTYSTKWRGPYKPRTDDSFPWWGFIKALFSHPAPWIVVGGVVFCLVYEWFMPLSQ